MEFCSYFEQIADPPNFLRKLALKFCLRQKSLKLRHSSNWAANLFKIWQNSNASCSVAYLFFIIYSKSTVGQPTHKLEFMQHYLIPSQSFLYIYYSLILTSFPMKLSIKFFLYKRSINDHIAILYNI